MPAISVKTIDRAISLLRRMRAGATKPSKSFNINSATAREITDVADGYMAVNTALLAVIMENVLETVAEEDAADALHQRLASLLQRMTTIEGVNDSAEVNNRDVKLPGERSNMPSGKQKLQ